MTAFTKFEDIEAWKAARILSNEIFALTKKKIFMEDSRLRNQMNGSQDSLWTI